MHDQGNARHPGLKCNNVAYNNRSHIIMTTSSRRLEPCRLTLAILAACASFSAQAQSTGSAAADPVTTLDAVQVTAPAPALPGLGLDTPTRSGSRTGLSIRDTPASVEALDADSLRARGDTRVSEAATRATGLSFIGTPGSGMSFSSRGFTGTNSVAQAEGGVRVLTAAGTQSYPSDTWGYERIEFLRGPASVLYGDGSVGGMLNLVRKAPSREAAAEVTLGGGSRGTYRVGVGGTAPLGEIAALRVDALAAGGDGPVHRGDHRTRKLMTGLKLAPNADVSIDLNLDVARDRPTAYFGTPMVDGRPVTALRRQNYNVADAVYALDDDRAKAAVSWRIAEHWTLRNEAHHHRSDRHWRNAENYRFDPASGQVARGDYLEILHDLKQTGNRLELASSAPLLGHSNRLVVGHEWISLDFTHTNNAPYGGSSSVPAIGFDPGRFESPQATLPKYTTDLTQHALFIENALDLGTRLTLVGGLRHDRIEVSRRELVAGTDFDKRFTTNALRLGGVLKLAANTNVYAQASTGSDPVTTVATLNLANRDFDLTSARQLEVGLKQDLPGGRGEWTLAAYHIVKNDIITRDPDTPAISIQGGRQSSRGVELAVGFQPARDWQIDANATVLNARFDRLVEAGGVSRRGNTPANVPERLANLWVTYRPAAWEVGMGLRHVGKRYTNNANSITLASYTVFDATAAWQLDARTTLRVNLRNLGDKVYATAAYGSTQALLSEARRVELVADLRF